MRRSWWSPISDSTPMMMISPQTPFSEVFHSFYFFFLFSSLLYVYSCKPFPFNLTFYIVVFSLFNVIFLISLDPVLNSIAQLYNLITKIKYFVLRKQIDLMYKRMDLNGDGRLDYDEFKAMILKHK